MRALTARRTMLATFPRAALFVLVVVAAVVLVLFLFLAYRLHGDGRPELALSTDPISLYVVNDGKVEELRSGVSPAWSPDGTRLAYKGDYDGNMWVDDRAFRLRVGPGGRVQWTPDGRSLLFEGNGIRLLDVRTGRDRLVAAGTLPALSPDGRSVAYLRYMKPKRSKHRFGSTLQIVSLAGGQPRVVARTHGSAYGPHFESRPQWLPDGTGVMVARRVARDGPWAVELVRFDGSRRVVVPRIGDEFALSPDGPEFALSPDGRLIAYQHSKGLQVARLSEQGRVFELGELLPTRYSALREFGGLSWSPDGQEIAFFAGGEDISSAASDSLLRVYALDVATGEIRRLAEIHDAISARLAWNPHP